jgi:hypothetical protein
MIINFIVSTLFTCIEAILGILPNVAATPDAIVSGGQWVTDQVANVISVLTMVFTAPLLTACVVCIVGMFSFEWIYHSVMWIIRKIPVVNIK